MKLFVESVMVVGEELCVAWSDGLESYVGFEALRRACPCAQCQGEPDVTGKVISLGGPTFGDGCFRLVRWEDVGGYAFQFFWGDGHSTWIFSYEYLRKL